MLSFLKKTPKLVDLIPANYVDIHSHILPGIDDGAQKMEDSEFLLDSMKNFRFSKVIATPHTMKNVWNNTTDSIEEAYNKVYEKLPDLAKNMKLQFSSEYFLDENLIEHIQTEKLIPLKNNYVLVEMSYLNAPLQLYDFLFELQLKGYQLVLAHPERYTFFHSKKKEFDKLKKSGCLFQLNLLATVGYYGKNVAEISDYLLKENMYDFVGSDIHHKNHVKAFQAKLTIKNQSKLEETIAKNVFFK